MNTPDDTRLISRRPLLGGLAAAAALSPAAASAAPAPGSAPLPSGDVLQAASRQQLAAMAGTVGQAALLTEPGRQGFFVLRDGAAPAGDPLQGLTVPSQRGGQHWARMWDGSQGLPEWFGARSGDPAAAAANREAIEACNRLCPITQLSAAPYYISDTLRLRVSNRTLRGSGIAIEPPFDQGTRILCTNPRSDVIHLGGNSAGDRQAVINLESVTAGWSVDLVAPPAGREGDAPCAFHVTHVNSANLRRCHTVNALIGFRFNGIINTRLIHWGVGRYANFGGGRDFLRGVWVQGSPRLFAGANASLYLIDGNVTTSAEQRAAYHQPMGIFADADFADLYILGLETSQIAFPIFLDGAGGESEGGHGDVHIRSLVLDQIIGDGITIRNTNPLAKIQIDGGYIQVVDSKHDNKGLWFENGGGAITVSNLQITGENISATSIGIYAKNRTNVAISDSVIVENIAFPVRIEPGCPRLSLSCTVNGGTMRARGHAAIMINGASQSMIQPKLTGNAGAFTAGIELIGAAHDRVSINPTMIDPTTQPAERKLVINGKPITTGGHYSGNGDRTPEGVGVVVSGVVG